MPHSLQDHPLLQNAPLIAGYRVLEPCVLSAKLGEGAMGVVFRGHHLNLGVEVAVKCLKLEPTQKDQDFIQRFQREARAGAMLDHPNTLRVYDVREVDGLHYFVMEFVPGENARERVTRKGALPWPEAVAICRAAAGAMAQAHRRGIVHRDLKPDNLMVSAAGAVKVTDLGLAKPCGEATNMTLSQAVFGTPRYMPPEQWENARDVGPQADVYALGATLYFLLAGAPGIEGNSLAEICKQTVRDGFPDVREKVSEVPSAVAEIVARATAMQPDERYPSAEELEEALAELDREAVDLRDAGADCPPGAQPAAEGSLPPEALEKIRTEISLQRGSVGPLFGARVSQPEGRTELRRSCHGSTPPRSRTIVRGRRTQSKTKSATRWLAAVAVLLAAGGSLWLLRDPPAREGDVAAGEKPLAPAPTARPELDRPKAGSLVSEQAVPASATLLKLDPLARLSQALGKLNDEVDDRSEAEVDLAEEQVDPREGQALSTPDSSSNTPRVASSLPLPTVTRRLTPTQTQTPTPTPSRTSRTQSKTPPPHPARGSSAQHPPPPRPPPPQHRPPPRRRRE